jgi:hypothetical protein
LLLKAKKGRRITKDKKNGLWLPRRGLQPLLFLIARAKVKRTVFEENHDSHNHSCEVTKIKKTQICPTGKAKGSKKTVQSAK